jgi:hypothetical protein
MTKIKTIDTGYYLIEIHHNPMLSNKPYLVRVYEYDKEPVEMRAAENEIKEFIGDIEHIYESFPEC